MPVKRERDSDDGEVGISSFPSVDGIDGMWRVASVPVGFRRLEALLAAEDRRHRAATERLLVCTEVYCALLAPAASGRGPAAGRGAASVSAHESSPTTKADGAAMTSSGMSLMTLAEVAAEIALLESEVMVAAVCRVRLADEMAALAEKCSCGYL